MFKIRLLVVIATLLFLPACVSPRISDSREFSVAGEAFSDAVILLTSEASSLAVDSDTRFLILQKSLLNEPSQSGMRKELIESHTSNLDNYLDNIRSMQQHVILLKRYFMHLGAISSESIRENSLEDSNTLIEALESVGISLASATIGDKQVSDLIPKATTYLVERRQNKLLETELRKRSAAILKELDHQQAYLRALQLQMERDISTLVNSRVFTDVAVPFVSNSALPSNWAKIRHDLYLTRISSTAAGNAAIANKKLKSVFIELIEGKSSRGKFAETMQSINQILDIVDVINSSS